MVYHVRSSSNVSGSVVAISRSVLRMLQRITTQVAAIDKARIMMSVIARLCPLWRIRINT